MINEKLEARKARRAIMWQLRDTLEDSYRTGLSFSPDLAKEIASMLVQDARRDRIIELLSAWPASDE